MGIEKNVGFDEFPKQGSLLGKQIEVYFNYDNSRTLAGKIVRDDMDKPYTTIIELENGKYILATECQYIPKD